MSEMLSRLKQEIEFWSIPALILGLIVGHLFWNAYLGTGPELFSILLSKKVLIELWIPLGGFLLGMIILFTWVLGYSPKKDSNSETGDIE